jgi:glycosyltransferase involved in cell wall biosynthesis
MKLSIITVSYNSSKTIESTIRSVLSQRIPDLEYIIIDGGSTDDTLSIIKRFKGRINVLISEPDSGIYDAMNKGIKIASGEVIGILNSDDVYADENVLFDVWQNFISNKDLDILYGDLVYVKQDNTDKVIRNWISLPYFNFFFETGNVPPHPSLFVTSKVYEKAGLFDLQFNLAADYEFMFRVFKKHSFKSKYINRLIVRMRLGGATNQSFKNIFYGNKQILKSWRTNGFKAPLYFFPLRIFKRLIQFF